MADDPFEYISWRGAIVDRKTVELLKILERRLGYAVDVIKGHSVASSGSVSATTHNKGGVCDLKPADHENKVRELRKLGCAAWFREAIPDLWDEHIHFVVIKHGNLDPAAGRQVESFLRGRDGLKGDNVDPNKFHPAFSPFSYDAAIKDAKLRAQITGWKQKISTARSAITYR